MFIIVIAIMAVGGGMMAYRAATGYKTEQVATGTSAHPSQPAATVR
jgi:hypothetical protein